MFDLNWNPTRELQRFSRDLDELFSGVSGTVHAFPPVNVWSSENDAVVTAELPGIESGDIDISVHGDALTLRGSRKPVELKENETFYRSERMRGEFSRTLKLPFRIDAEKVSATFNKGVLSIQVPRAEADKPRKISVKAA
jgi:HSP20 family protein